MARMIPSRPVPGRSPGEPDVFVRLRDDPSTTDWIVLHSLDVATHRTQTSGEADFVVIIPHKGVLFVEVKACTRLRRDSGIWFLGSLPGEPRGPFKQAAETMHSLRERLARARPDLSRVPFYSCVIFSHMPFRESSVEWHSWQVIDSLAMRAAPLGRLLRDVMAHARLHIQASPSGGWLHPGAKEPYMEQCEDIAEFFRPDFECFQDYKTLAAQIEAELRYFTDEQVICLDSMESNPRVLFTGPAGTGKTILAVECARRASGQEQTLLVCYNRLLGSRLSKECGGFVSGLRAKTLHSHMLEVAGLKHVPPSADRDFWEIKLPSLATDCLLASADPRYLFDQLIVDEAQDILRANYLDFLDLSLRGGLSAGKWKMFGDFEKQAIYGSANLSLDDFYGRLSTRPAEYGLRVNCRNTPSVAALAQILGGLSPGYKRILRPYDGIEPEYKYYKSDAEQLLRIEETLADLFDRGLSGKDIVILSTRGDDAAAAGRIETAAWRDRIRPFDGGEGGYIRYCSIHSFKGLEAPVIIVTDLDNSNRQSFESLVYVAVTRSLHRVILVMRDQLRTGLLAGGDV